MKSVLVNLVILLWLPNKRRRICSFSNIVKRCKGRLEAQFNMNKIPFKIQQLKDQWNTLDPLLREVRLNRIDELATELLMNLKNIQKLKTGEMDYSPETAAAGKNFHSWKFLLRHNIYERNFFSELLTLHTDLNIVYFNCVTLEKVKQNVTNIRLTCLKHKHLFHAVTKI